MHNVPLGIRTAQRVLREGIRTSSVAREPGGCLHWREMRQPERDGNEAVTHNSVELVLKGREGKSHRGISGRQTLSELRLVTKKKLSAVVKTETVCLFFDFSLETISWRGLTVPIQNELEVPTNLTHSFSQAILQ